MDAQEKQRLFWTDGSADPNPGEGGFAVMERIDGRAVPVALGYCEHTTNVRMEGRAIIEAMKLAKGKPCKINTDSKFWINVLKKWAPMWELRDWTKSTPGEIKNLDLVKEAHLLYQYGKVTLHWTKGHSASFYNQLADRWAHNARNRKFAPHLQKVT